MTMITPSYLGETIEYSSLHACRSTLEDPTDDRQRSGSHFDIQAADLSLDGPRYLSEAEGWRSVFAPGQRRVQRKIWLEVDWLQRDADAVFASGADVELCRLIVGSDFSSVARGSNCE